MAGDGSCTFIVPQSARSRYVIHVAVLGRQKTPPKDRHSSNASLMNYKCATACCLNNLYHIRNTYICFVLQLLQLLRNLLCKIVNNIPVCTGNVASGCPYMSTAVKELSYL